MWLFIGQPLAGKYSCVAKPWRPKARSAPAVKAVGRRSETVFGVRKYRLSKPHSKLTRCNGRGFERLSAGSYVACVRLRVRAMKVCQPMSLKPTPILLCAVCFFSVVLFVYFFVLAFDSHALRGSSFANDANLFVSRSSACRSYRFCSCFSAESSE